jgi:hypothetical protein
MKTINVDHYNKQQHPCLSLKNKRNALATISAHFAMLNTHPPTHSALIFSPLCGCAAAPSFEYYIEYKYDSALLAPLSG